jgi:hypothetical protein
MNLSQLRRAVWLRRLSDASQSRFTLLKNHHRLGWLSVKAYDDAITRLDELVDRRHQVLKTAADKVAGKSSNLLKARVRKDRLPEKSTRHTCLESIILLLAEPQVVPVYTTERLGAGSLDIPNPTLRESATVILCSDFP